eukprot:PhF_6_TR13550/c0_g1_i1/m.21659/K15255/PIF1; ATP-dependent DNA helicase PIF1
MPKLKVSNDSVLAKVIVESDSGEMIRPWCGSEVYITNENDLGRCLVVKNGKHKKGQGTFFQLRNISVIHASGIRNGKISIELAHLKRKCTVHIASSPESKAEFAKLAEILCNKSLWETIPEDVSRADGKRSREEGAAEDGNDGAREVNVEGLTEEQIRAMQAIADGKSVFITGCAGTGKTFLVRKIISALPPETTYVTASTGIAALEIGGQTLHSFAGTGADTGITVERAVQSINAHPGAAHAWRSCKVLVVDEISMVAADFFQLLDAVGKSLRRKPKEPFGGIQLILAGDFFQLPPIIKNATQQKVFCFEAEAWESVNPVVVELTKVFRQVDTDLVGALGDVRKGIVSDRVKATFAPCIGRHLKTDDGIIATSLRAANRDVDTINAAALEKLPGTAHTFVAIDTADSDYHRNILTKDSSFAETLSIKTGAQVVLLSALPEIHESLVNGCRGVVVGLSPLMFPIVRFTQVPNDVVVPRVKQEVRLLGKYVAAREQIPLRLAWALSIHKSQGMSIDRLEINLDRTVFEYGQAYVALSRAVSLEGLSIVSFDASVVKAHPHVLKYFGYLD